MKLRLRIARQRRAAVWQQAFAWGGLALIVILNVLAASPQAHAWVHGREFVVESYSPKSPGGDQAGAPVDADHEAGCVVTQFSHGWITHTLTLLVSLAAVWWVRFLAPSLASQIHSVATGELPRCCGPPVV